MTKVQKDIVSGLLAFHHRAWVSLDELGSCIGKSMKQITKQVEVLAADKVLDTTTRQVLGEQLPHARLTPRGRRVAQELAL